MIVEFKKLTGTPARGRLIINSASVTHVTEAEKSWSGGHFTVIHLSGRAEIAAESYEEVIAKLGWNTNTHALESYPNIGVAIQSWYEDTGQGSLLILPDIMAAIDTLRKVRCGRPATPEAVPPDPEEELEVSYSPEGYMQRSTPPISRGHEKPDGNKLESPRLTAEMLIQYGARPDCLPLKAFRDEWPDGATITAENIARARTLKLPLCYGTCALPPQLAKVFRERLDPALQKYLAQGDQPGLKYKAAFKRSILGHDPAGQVCYDLKLADAAWHAFCAAEKADWADFEDAQTVVLLELVEEFRSK